MTYKYDSFSQYSIVLTVYHYLVHFPCWHCAALVLWVVGVQLVAAGYYELKKGKSFDYFTLSCNLGKFKYKYKYSMNL